MLNIITIPVKGKIKKIKEKKKIEMLEEIKGDKMEVKINVNDANFETKVIEQSKNVPVVVDFWATWCMPCVMLGPTLDGLVKEFGEKFVLAKLNVDENLVTSTKFGIQSIPAVKMYKGGKVIDEFVGALPESTVREWLSKNGLNK